MPQVTTGWFRPSNYVAGDFTSPENAYEDDGAYATRSFTSTPSSQSYVQSYYDFVLVSDGTTAITDPIAGVPSEATSIDAIHVRAHAYAATTQVNLFARIDDGTSQVSTNTLVDIILTGSEALYPDVDPFYAAITAPLPSVTQVRETGSSGMRLRMNATKTTTGARTLYLDDVQLRVVFTVPTVAVRQPVRYRLMQRDNASAPGAGTKTVRVAGTLFEAATGGLYVQAGHDRSAWTSVPSGNWTGASLAYGSSFYADVPAGVGYGLRFGQGAASAPSAFGTDQEFELGDLLLGTGQSNMAGTDTATTPTLRGADAYGGFVGGLMKQSETAGVHDWGPLDEPTRWYVGQDSQSPDYYSAGDGGWVAAALGLVMGWTGIPIGLVNVARGAQKSTAFRRGYMMSDDAPVYGDESGSSANWHTAGPNGSASNQPTTLFEESVQRLQQSIWQSSTGASATDLPSAANGASPNYYVDGTGRDGGGGVAPLAHSARAVLYFQGEADADVDPTAFATNWTAASSGIQDSWDLALNTGASWDANIVLATIGEYSGSANDADLMTVREAQRSARANGSPLVRWGPDFYDLDLNAGAGGDGVHLSSVAANDTMWEATERWALALYSTLYASDAASANYRQPAAASATIDAANDRVNVTFDQPIDDPGASVEYSNVRVTLNSVAQTHVAASATPTSGEIKCVWQDASTMRIYFGSDISTSDTILISFGYGNAATGGQIVPKRTLTIDYAQLVLDLEPHSFWRLGEASGNFADATGNGHTAVAVGSPGYGASATPLTYDTDDACDFGSGDSAQVDGSDSHFGTDAVTVCGWHKANTHDGTARVLIQHADFVDEGIQVKLHTDNTLRALVGTGSGGYRTLSTSFTPTAGEWYFWALVAQDGEQALYVCDQDRWFRAVAADTYATWAPETGGSVQICGGGGQAVGVLDEIVWFDRALSADDLRRIAWAYAAYPIETAVPVAPVKDLAASGATTYYATLGGTLTPTGTSQRQTAKPFAGTLIPAAAATKQTATAVAGTLAPAGTHAGQPGKVLAGAVTPSGGFAALPQKALAGTIAPAGTLGRATSVTVEGAIAPAGGPVKALYRVIAGALAPSGTLTSELNPGAQTFYATLTGTIVPFAALTRDTATAFSGAVTPAGTVTRDTQTAFSGTIAPAGTHSYTRVILHAVGGTLAPAGALMRQTGRALAGTIAPAGTLEKAAARTFTGTISPLGQLATVRVFLLAVAGTIQPSGGLARQTGHTAGGTLEPAGTVTREPRLMLSGATTPTGSAGRLTARTFAGAITPAGGWSSLLANNFRDLQISGPTGRRARRNLTVGRWGRRR